MTMIRSRSLVACHAFVLLALVPTVALAHDGEHASGGGAAPSSDTTSDDSSKSDGPKGPEKLALGVDWVMGFGKVVAAEQQFQGSTQITPSNVIVSAPFRTQTFLLGAHYAFDSIGLGLRMPLTNGNIRDASSNITGENVFTIGGIAIALDLPKKLSDSLTITPELELVAPTAQGDAPPTPEALAKINPAAFDKYASYKYSANLSGAMSHGYEDDALFWSHRVGIVPKLGVSLHTGKVTLDPYVKVPVMIDTHTDSDERLRLEVVAGARLAYAITPWLQPGVRVWAMVPVAAQSGFLDPVGVVEPQIRIHADNTFSVTVGGILPFAGALTDPYVGAVRATINAAF
jgi:hypothetical protein